MRSQLPNISDHNFFLVNPSGNRKKYKNYKIKKGGGGVVVEQ